MKAPKMMRRKSRRKSMQKTTVQARKCKIKFMRKSSSTTSA